MRADRAIMAAIEDAFNRHAAEPLDALGAVSKLSALHGAEAVLAALAQVHIVTAAHLRARRLEEQFLCLRNSAAK